MTFFFMENNIYTLFLLRKENNVDTKQTSYMGSSVGVLIFWKSKALYETALMAFQWK